jgi:hypothetical protein
MLTSEVWPAGFRGWSIRALRFVRPFCFVLLVTAVALHVPGCGLEET